MSKTIECGDIAKDNILQGIDKVADIVKTTIGPRGRNVLIRNQVSKPIITNDGVTIAKSIELKDTAQDAGAQLVISAADKTNQIAGDGTTTTTLLAQTMIHKYYELTKEASDVNVVKTQKEMIKAGDDISNYLTSIAIPVEDNTKIEKVATISSGNEETGKLIAQAFESAGKYGSVIVEDSKSGTDALVNIQGMRIPNGIITPYLLNDRSELKSDIYDAYLLVVKDKIDNAADLLPVLDQCVKSSIKLVIMCDDIDYEPLTMIISNKARGVPLNVSVIRTPGFGKLREDLLDDICIATGATLIDRGVGLTLKQFSLDQLGELEQVTITMDQTVMKFKDISQNGTDLLTARTNRANELQSILQNTTNSEDTEQYKRRISNLLSGISVIQVGGNSDLEIKDKKLRIEDAINSVQSAIDEGIVPGGGYSLLLAVMNSVDKQYNLGEQVVYESLNCVMKQIADNAGFNGSEVVTNCYNKQLGFNALTGQYEDLLQSGVINSVKVDRYSVINAVSVASTVITMGGYIVEENEPDKNVLQLQTPVM